jgi:hypothetical protein
VERVKNNLAALFKVDAARLNPLFQDRLVVLKNNLSLGDADQYRDTVDAVGGYCIIEAMGEAPERSVMNAAGKTEKMACPRCHVVQPKMPICRACGTQVQEYNRRLEATQSAVIASLSRNALETGAPPREFAADKPRPGNGSEVDKST